MNAIDQEIHAAATSDLARVQEHFTRSWRSRPEAVPDEGWTHETRFAFVDGTTVTLNGRWASDLPFPATPGFELLRFDLPGHGDPVTAEIANAIVRKPIIGWILRNEGEIDPITPNGVEDRYPVRSFRAISLPGGRVQWRAPWHPKIDEIAGASCVRPITFETVEDWIAAVRLVWAELIAQRERAAQLKKSCPTCGRGPHSDDDLPF